MNRRLLLGMVLGPLAWLGGLELLFALVPWTCRHPTARAGIVLPAIGAVTMLTSIIAAAVAWRARRPGDSGAPDGASDRVRFMALTGVGSGALFTLVALAATIPIFVLSSCE